MLSKVILALSKGFWWLYDHQLTSLEIPYKISEGFPIKFSLHPPITHNIPKVVLNMHS